MAHINTAQPYMPSQTIKVDFVKLADSPEYSQFKTLQRCKLCDSITVIFPKYKTEGQFKIVKTEYDVLRERYSSLELGTLAVTLSEALGINQESATRLRSSLSADDYVVEQGTTGGWSWRKWNSGTTEAWASGLSLGSQTGSNWVSPIKYKDLTPPLPSGVFTNTPTVTMTSAGNQWWVVDAYATSSTSMSARFATLASSAQTIYVNVYAKG